MSKLLEDYESIHTCALPPMLGPELPVCKRCKQTYTICQSIDGHCVECQSNIDRGYLLRVKGGRAWNGAHRDMGQVVHAKSLERDGFGYPEYGFSICGDTVGRRSIGWVSYVDVVVEQMHNEPTCKKCRKKLGLD
jgi:hypothetical protein